MVNPAIFDEGNRYRYGPDIGNALLTRENIQTARERNALLSAGRKRDEQMQEAREAAIDGDMNAIGRMIALDPQEARQFLLAWRDAGEDERIAAAQAVERMGKGASYVLSGGTPEEMAARYSMLIGAGYLGDDAPAEWGPQAERFTRLRLAQATNLDTIIEHQNKIAQTRAEGEQERETERVKGENALAKTRAEGEQDRLTDNRRTINNLTELQAEAALGVKGRKGRGGDGDMAGLKSADTNAIYRQAVQMFGGVMDEEGNIQSLSPTLARDVQGVAARASRIYADGDGRITHAEAVQQAYREHRGRVGDKSEPERDGEGSGGGSVGRFFRGIFGADDSGNNDPLGIR